VDADGSSRISAEDFAEALVDDLERGAPTRARVTVAY
jgi:putative NADH-flavin reductase